MSMTVKQRVLDQATKLAQSFTDHQALIEQMTPQEQIAKTPFVTESLDAQNLFILQAHVQDTYANKQNAIPNVTDEEIKEIEAKLSLCTEVLESLDANLILALEINELAEKASKLFSAARVDLNEVKSLKERVTALNSAPGINTGNLDVLYNIEQTLNCMGSHSQQSNGPSIQSSSTQQTQSMLIAQQDEDFHVSSFVDKFTDLSYSLAYINPSEDFEKVLPFYAKVKKYAAEKIIFIESKNQQLVNKVLMDAEALMQKLIHMETEIEKSQQTQSVQTNPSSSPSLTGLDEALEFACTEIEKNSPDMMAITQKVKTAFSKLSLEEKEKLHKALSDILIEAKKNFKSLPLTLLNVDFLHWGGNYPQKRDALNRIMPQQTVQTSPVIMIEKKSEQMNKRLQNSVMNNSPSVRTHRDIAITSSPVHSNSDVNLSETANSPIHNGIQELAKLLPLLHTNAKAEVFEYAMFTLIVLERANVMLPFQISDHTPINIAERPRVHLSCIHQHENQQKLEIGESYGLAATTLQGTHFTTNAERCRAIRRTIVELALEGLEDAINFAYIGLEVEGLENANSVQIEEIGKMLKILEEIQMDPRDLTAEQKNLAHCLFGFMYNLHCDARKTNASLIDPHDSQFKSDFGRNGFTCFVRGTVSGVKIDAINALRRDLKAAWKL
jgi:hypothetical protein